MVECSWMVVASLAQGWEGLVSGDGCEVLSERELEILRLVATGVTNRQIAVELTISPNTVKVHLRNIFAKLGVESRTEATLVAIQNGWVEVPVPASTDVAAGALPAGLSWQRRAFVALALSASLFLALWPPALMGRAGQDSALTDSGAVTTSPADPDTVQRWSARAAMSEARQRFACASYEKRIYTIGGDTAGGVTGEVAAYDPAADTWEERADKPTAVSNVGAAVLGGEIYVPGGYDGLGRTLDVLEVYNPSTDSWRSASPLPEPRCAYAVAEAGGRLYVLGGWDGNRYVADVLVYDPAADCWSRGTPLGRACGFAAAATVDGRIYLVGGLDGAKESASCDVYDPSLEGSSVSPWSTLAPMAQPRAGLGLAVAGRRLYAVGGGWNGGLAFNESYDIAANRWQPFPSPVLGQWRTLGVAAAQSSLGTTLYAVGGWTGERVATNQAYRALLNVYLPELP